MISGETDRHRLVSGLQNSRNFVLTATFRPTECLLAPALCLPRAVLRGDDTRTRLRSPSRCLLGGPVSVPRSRYLNPSARDRGVRRNSRGPSAGRGVGQCAGANDGPIASGESASAAGNKATVLVCCRSTSRQLHRNRTLNRSGSNRHPETVTVCRP